MTVSAIIVAAGRGTRAGGDQPKQWQQLGAQRVIDWTLEAFLAVPCIAKIVVVLHPDETDRLTQNQRLSVVPGGATRAQSVRNGLDWLATQPDTPDHVLIHDAARCCISPAHITDIITALRAGPHAALAPALPVTDALWRGQNDTVTGTQDRGGLYRAQTPQAFDFAAILAAHQAHKAEAADDVEVARAAGIPVHIVPGDESNLKITTPADFKRAEAILTSRKDPNLIDIRTGTGFDVHRFGPGTHVTLCGVDVPHHRALQGHSDADVGMHALTDAIYGALAMGDIGRHFPPTDPQWKGAASRIFLRHAVDLAAENGFAISNVDITLICEQPKIGPHAPAMIAALSEIMDLDPTRISVKATTSERLGFTGREEGIAAQAAATLVKE